MTEVQANPTTARVGRTLVLASTSPRRAAILREYGVPFRMESPSVDDATLFPGAVSPEEWVTSLAYLKARSVADRLRRAGERGLLVLGADTLVVKGDEIIGQPRDEADALRILRLLERGKHRVVTGVALLGDDVRRRLFADAAEVRVGAIGEDRMRAYIASGDWRGKAGAYNLSERIADGWPIEHVGDPTTIMGLPMRALAPMLGSWLGGANATVGMDAAEAQGSGA